MSSPATETSEDILVRRDGPVAIVTLNRPERLNAFTAEMRDLYLQTLQSLDQDENVRAIVVTGAGRAFSAGADFKSLEGLDAAELQRRRAGSRLDMDFPRQLSTPLIAAINGAVAGIAVAHALFADVRFISEDAFLTTAFSRIGLTAEGGLAWTLSRTVGPANALDLLMSSRRVSAQEGHRLGLFQYLSAPGVVLDEAVAYARRLADEISPYSMASMRTQVHAAADQTWDEAYAMTKGFVNESLDRPEFGQRVRAKTDRGQR